MSLASLGAGNDARRVEPVKLPDNIEIRHDVASQWTIVEIKFTPEELPRMDRREFRRWLSERLCATGDAFEDAWLKMKEKQERQP